MGGRDRITSAEFRKSSPDLNRRVLAEAVTTTAKEGRAPGLIAYRESDPIGWVSIGPRDDFESLRHSRLLARVDDEQVWSIVCFVVSRRARGEGVFEVLDRRRANKNSVTRTIVRLTP